MFFFAEMFCIWIVFFEKKTEMQQDRDKPMQFWDFFIKVTIFLSIS